jgi:hypothetical protein
VYFVCFYIFGPTCINERTWLPVELAMLGSAAALYGRAVFWSDLGYGFDESVGHIAALIWKSYTNFSINMKVCI